MTDRGDWIKAVLAALAVILILGFIVVQALLIHRTSQVVVQIQQNQHYITLLLQKQDQGAMRGKSIIQIVDAICKALPHCTSP